VHRPAVELLRSRRPARVAPRHRHTWCWDGRRRNMCAQGSGARKWLLSRASRGTRVSLRLGEAWLRAQPWRAVASACHVRPGAQRWRGERAGRGSRDRGCAWPVAMAVAPREQQSEEGAEQPRERRVSKERRAALLKAPRATEVERDSKLGCGPARPRPGTSARRREEKGEARRVDQGDAGAVKSGAGSAQT